jgi:hypothetical protein
MKEFRISIVLSAALLLSLGTFRSARAGSLMVYVEAPTVQSSQVTGPGVTVTTESFDNFPTGAYSNLATTVGQLTAPAGFEVLSANAYGGAGGTGNFLEIDGSFGSYIGPVAVALRGPQAYFGLWWSAADRLNQVSLYDSSGNFLGSFNTQYFLNALSTFSDASQYYGNPNNGQDPSEPFFYVNFVATNGESISQVIVSNPSSAGYFESDNWSISAVTPTGGLGTLISGSLISVPEPSSLIFALPMCILICLAHTGRRLGGRTETGPVVIPTRD